MEFAHGTVTGVGRDDGGVEVEGPGNGIGSVFQSRADVALLPGGWTAVDSTTDGSGPEIHPGESDGAPASAVAFRIKSVVVFGAETEYGKGDSVDTDDGL